MPRTIAPQRRHKRYVSPLARTELFAGDSGVRVNLSIRLWPHNPMELTVHSVGILGCSWRFLLWAAAYHKG